MTLGTRMTRIGRIAVDQKNPFKSIGEHKAKISTDNFDVCQTKNLCLSV